MRIETIVSGIVFALIGAIAGWLLSNQYIGGLQMGVLTVLFCLMWIAFVARTDLVLFFSRHRFSFGDFMSIVTSFTDERNVSIFSLNTAEQHSLRNRLETLPRTRRPTVFYQIRFKRHVNWIDCIYWRLLGALSKAGYRVVILLHDYEYVNENNSVRCQCYARDYEADVRAMIAWMQRIAGDRIRILRASRFFQSRRVSGVFADLIYRAYIPFLANQRPAPKDSSINPLELAHDLRYVIGVLLVQMLRPKDVFIMLVWEGRRDFWTETTALLPSAHKYLFTLVGHTITTLKGERINNQDADGVLALNHPIEKQRALLDQMDDHTLTLLVKVVTNPEEWSSDWKDKGREFLKAKALEGLNRLRV